MSTRSMLDSLPNELKTTIARKCFEADQNYKELMKEMSGWEQLHRDITRLISDNARIHGHSIYNLSLVSKNWREITAPWIFRKLHVAKVLDPIFVLCVNPLRFEFFVEADLGPAFASCPSYHQNIALRHLATSARLTSLSVASTNFKLLTPPSDPVSSGYLAQAQHAVILRAFARITEVTFRVHGNSEWPSSRLLEMFPRVRNFSIQILSGRDRNEESLKNLREGLTFMPDVKALEMKTSTGIDLSPLYSPTALLPPLTSVFISAIKVHPSILDLAQALSQSLEKLTLEFTIGNHRENESDLRFLDHHCFEKLHTLSLLGPRATVQPIFSSASSRHLPSLRYLHLAFDYFQVDEDVEEVPDKLLNLKQFDRLRFFELVDRKWTIDESQRLDLEDYAESIGLVGLVGDKGAPFDSMVLWDSDKQRPVCEPSEAVLRIQEFLEERVEEARWSKTDAEWYRLVALLRPLELERVAIMA